MMPEEKVFSYLLYKKLKLAVVIRDTLSFSYFIIDCCSLKKATDTTKETIYIYIYKYIYMNALLKVTNQNPELKTTGRSPRRRIIGGHFRDRWTPDFLPALFLWSWTPALSSWAHFPRGHPHIVLNLTGWEAAVTHLNIRHHAKEGLLKMKAHHSRNPATVETGGGGTPIFHFKCVWMNHNDFLSDYNVKNPTDLSSGMMMFDFPVIPHHESTAAPDQIQIKQWAMHLSCSSQRKHCFSLPH